MLQGTLCLFSLPWDMIQGCRNENHDTLWGYSSEVTHVPLALWWVWDSSLGPQTFFIRSRLL